MNIHLAIQTDNFLIGNNASQMEDPQNSAKHMDYDYTKITTVAQTAARFRANIHERTNTACLAAQNLESIRFYSSVLPQSNCHWNPSDCI